MATALGIDIGGTDLRVALVGDGGKVLSHARTATAASAGPEAVIAQIVALAGSLTSPAGASNPAGIGIGSPGPLDAERGLVQSPPTLAGWHDVPLAAIVADRLNLPTALDNDGHVAALGEWRYGAARSASTFAYVTISTGIGGGLVVDGRMLRGAGGRAGHVGHMVTTDAPLRCVCGNLGCWEAMASGTALARAARQAVAEAPDSLLARLAAERDVDGRLVGEAARAGDAVALALVEAEARSIAAGLTSLIHLISPQRIVIGGGLSALLDLMQPTIEAEVARRTMAVFHGVDIVAAELGPATGVIGAAALILAPDRATRFSPRTHNEKVSP
ncbi:MAG: ROK family protein [Ancalomicrobiaceae bacterium]|nr:ROK family protein [Ancalomicrobiaceae bacterium]